MPGESSSTSSMGRFVVVAKYFDVAPPANDWLSVRFWRFEDRSSGVGAGREFFPLVVGPLQLMVLTGPCWLLRALCSLYQHRHVSSWTDTKADGPIVNSCLRDHPERSRECQREDRVSGAVQGPTHSPGTSWLRSNSELRDCSLCVRAGLLSAKRRAGSGSQQEGDKSSAHSH